MRLKGRVERLETQRRDVLAEPFRIVVTTPVEFDLTKSTCSRTRYASGLMMEIIRLHGMREHIADSDFDWVESFPIEDAKQ